VLKPGKETDEFRRKLEKIFLDMYHESFNKDIGDGRVKSKYARRIDKLFIDSGAGFGPAEQRILIETIRKVESFVLSA